MRSTTIAARKKSSAVQEARITRVLSESRRENLGSLAEWGVGLVGRWCIGVTGALVIAASLIDSPRLNSVQTEQNEGLKEKIW